MSCFPLLICLFFFSFHTVSTLYEQRVPVGWEKKEDPRPMLYEHRCDHLSPQPSTAHQFYKGHIFIPFLRNEYPKTSHTIRPQATFSISSALTLATSQLHWTPCKPSSSSETFTHSAPSGWNDIDKCSPPAKLYLPGRDWTSLSLWNLPPS